VAVTGSRRGKVYKEVRRGLNSLSIHHRPGEVSGPGNSTMDTMTDDRKCGPDIGTVVVPCGGEWRWAI
jgi:hypothetical protein